MSLFTRKSGPSADPAERAPAGSAELSGDEPKATVLVVDDSPTETRIYANTLSQAGYRVESAADGEQGVEMARRLKPDVIIMDVIMPTLNGFQATRMLHRDAETAAIPIVIVTTKDQPTDRTWGLRQGAVDYLVKPVSPAALLAVVRSVLGR
jgi:twitching motility two-component system response regulator PilH